MISKTFGSGTCEGPVGGRASWHRGHPAGLHLKIQIGVVLAEDSVVAVAGINLLIPRDKLLTDYHVQLKGHCLSMFSLKVYKTL